MGSRLPPFGRQFLPVPETGIRVAIGPTAWEFQQSHSHPVMVLPEDKVPANFSWPSDGRAALVFERGPCNDERLFGIARTLIIAGASSVVAIRETLLGAHDPRVYFDPEVRYVSG